MNDIRNYIAINLLEGIGSIQAKNLIAYCGSVEQVFKQNKNTLLRIPGIGPKTANNIVTGNVFKKAEEEVEFIEKYKIDAIPYTKDSYPKRLSHCADSPLLIYKKGAADLNYKKTIGIVGTRKATKYGKDFIIGLTEQLSAFNIQIVSGLALGIDGQAHKSAIDNKLNTVAVLANALNTVYPNVHKNLAQSIIKEGGALVTEYPSISKLHPSNFPMRNRIIAGMCDAIIIVESAIKGGAIITANIANSYNRDVFALPGRYKDKNSVGCNFLLKTYKAQVIESAEDLILALGWENQKNKPKKIQRQLALDLNEDEKKIVNVLKDSDGLETDLIMVKTNINGSKLAALLLELELKGIIYGLPGNRFVLN